MKLFAIATAFAVALAPSTAIAADMKGEMKGMDMKGMSKDSKSGAKHVAKGTVKAVDPKAGTVNVSHEPVKTMNWPAMNMTFKVQDKSLLDKLSAGKQVEFEFEQRGKDYVITGAK